ncbi:hypothetical protein H5410_051724 [Solanum commersonii]|uniref:Uncharacterized protein n=1 Tax=Solanum commersonii TaxID=4109 RepID=A0A9J5WYW8_SOLCO|nr:hypothetical protein H5410_051724 [Solanum commersonii]
MDGEVSTPFIKYNIMVPNFDEVTIELLYGVAHLNLNQLANYIIDVHGIDKRFSDFKWALYDLSKRLVETKKKHSCYSLVFRLVKFVLLQSVVTTSVERAIFTMKFIKNDLQMNDEFLSGCMPPL